MFKKIFNKNKNVSVELTSEEKLLNQLFDTNYDHYYDDVKAIDARKVERESNPELVRNILLLIGGAALAIVICGVIIAKSGFNF